MKEELKIKETPTCPHCGQKMSKCETPTYNFGDVSSGWNDPFLYICFNDECKFFVEGWERMKKYYGKNASYRFMYQPTNGIGHAIAVFSKDALKGQICKDETEST